ncbi:MAG: hypothetical protein LBP25_06060 [Tannerellaceae bacterium]|jgi:hypothetical protein|nr:hypothetical protein [Tannerellaceae bacterium]
MKTKWKLFFTVFAVVLAVSYLLGVLRWQWEFASVLYGILNIPFGVSFLFFDRYFWTELGPSHWVNDEIVSSLYWLASVLLQAILYYFAVLKFGLYRQK